MKKRILCAVLSLMMLAALLVPGAVATEARASGSGSNSAVAEARNGVVRVFALGESTSWVGSAFGIGTIGEETDTFVTNRHCVIDEATGKPARRIYLVVDGNSYNGEELYYVDSAGNTVGKSVQIDPDTERMIPCDVIYHSDVYDVAVIQATREVEGRIALELATAENVNPADTVYAMGYPAISDETASMSDLTLKGTVQHETLGLLSVLSRTFSRSSLVKDITVTTGVVSRHTVMESYNDTDVIQHDAQIHGGSSGGPLVNAKGQVVGINTYGGSEANLNYAVYIDYARQALTEEEIPFNVRPVNILLIVGIVVAVAAVAAVVILIVKNKGNGKEKRTMGKKMPFVRSMAVQHGGIRVDMQKNQAVIIGRSRSDCAIVFTDNTPGVSSKHCSLTWDGAAFQLIDMGSTYGTYVQNGQKLTPGIPYALQAGSTFWLGDKQNVLRVDVE